MYDDACTRSRRCCFNHHIHSSVPPVGSDQDKQDSAALQDSNLIGQFGVGFYSAFLVADKVRMGASIGIGPNGRITWVRGVGWGVGRRWKKAVTPPSPTHKI